MFSCFFYDERVSLFAGTQHSEIKVFLNRRASLFMSVQASQRPRTTLATTLARAARGPRPQASRTHSRTRKELQASCLKLAPRLRTFRMKSSPTLCLTSVCSQNFIVFYRNKFTRSRL